MPSKQPKKLNLKQLLIYGLAGIAGMCLLCLGLTLAADSLGLQAAPTTTPTQAPLQPAASETPVPSETPIPSTSPTPEPSATPSPSATATATASATAPRAACLPAGAQPERGQVTEVIDGDTIRVLIDGQEYPLRYIGIDSPEKDGPLGLRAYELNQELVGGQAVRLFQDVSESDIYARLLRYVFVGDVFVNYEMVAAGLASAREYPPDTACSGMLQEAQATAQAAQLGLWAAVPTSPPQSGGGSAPCACSSNLYNCSDFGRQSQAQACFEACRALGVGDIHHLDGDNDGRVCESLP